MLEISKPGPGALIRDIWLSEFQPKLKNLEIGEAGGRVKEESVQEEGWPAGESCELLLLQSCLVSSLFVTSWQP